MSNPRKVPLVFQDNTLRTGQSEKRRLGMGKYIVLACLMAAALAAAPAVGAQAGPATISNALAVPDGNVLLFKTFATGTQIYTCAPQPDDPETFVWTFKAPEAELQNELGQRVGSHDAGPTWEGNDGSRVVGEVVARVDAPEPGAIPWLLLKARTTAGRGAFSTITYIQRLDTVGGVAPTGGCDHSTADAVREIPYTAVYAFYYGA
jgi:hypothetical protein